MNIRDEVRRLIRHVRDLEDRVRDLESDPSEDDGGGESLIGFEIDASDDFDEDDPEYVSDAHEFV